MALLSPTTRSWRAFAVLVAVSLPTVPAQAQEPIAGAGPLAPSPAPRKKSTGSRNWPMPWAAATQSSTHETTGMC